MRTDGARGPRGRAEALEAEELRLLACAVGDHLPFELALRVETLRGERALLAAASRQRAHGAGDR